jgi:hypothetical protein
MMCSLDLRCGFRHRENIQHLVTHARHGRGQLDLGVETGLNSERVFKARMTLLWDGNGVATVWLSSPDTNWLPHAKVQLLQ